MSINCEAIGHIEIPLASDDEVQPSFNISTWLDTDAIATVAYSAFDEEGTSATATALDALKHTNTTTVINPWIKGGGINHKQYTVKMKVVTVNGETKSFYIKYKVRDIGE